LACEEYDVEALGEANDKDHVDQTETDHVLRDYRVDLK
jgi:hypothetical protein